jgi:flagellar hook-associated protein 3 FlgL
MRITNNMIHRQAISNMGKNLTKLHRFQNQISSGKELSRPSENPMAFSKIFDLHSHIRGNEQFGSNIRDSIGWVDTQDSALQNAGDILHRVRDLVIYGSNGTKSQADIQIIKDEIIQNIQGFRDVMNTNLNGKYIFGGQETTNPPFAVEGNDLIYQGNEINLTREISKGVSIDLLTAGSELVGSGNLSEDTLGMILSDIITAFEEGDQESLSGELLGRLDQGIERFFNGRAKIGGISNRLEGTERRNNAENLEMKTLLSSIEDVDIAEKYMEYSIMANVYQASLAAGAKILQLSLMDYLR